MPKQTQVFSVKKGEAKPRLVKEFAMEKYSPVAWNPKSDLLVYLEENILYDYRDSFKNSSKAGSEVIGVYIP